MTKPAEKLVYMANQIGGFFATQPGERAIDEIADHLAKFWDPRMRAAIVAHLAAGGEGLHPLVRAAVARLREARHSPVAPSSARPSPTRGEGSL